MVYVRAYRRCGAVLCLSLLVAACGAGEDSAEVRTGPPALAASVQPLEGAGSWIAGRTLHLERRAASSDDAGEPRATATDIELAAPFGPSESGFFDAAQASADLTLIGYLGWEPGDPSAISGYDGPLPADDDPVGRSILHLVTDTGEVVDSIEGVTSFAISAGGAVAIARKEDPWSYTGNTQPSSLSVRLPSGEVVEAESSGDSSPSFWLGDTLLYATSPNGGGGEFDDADFELRAFSLEDGERRSIGRNLVAYLPLNDHQALVQPSGSGLAELAVWDVRKQALTAVPYDGEQRLQLTGLRANLDGGRLAVHYYGELAATEHVLVLKVQEDRLELDHIIDLDPDVVVSIDSIGAGSEGSLVGWGLDPSNDGSDFVAFSCGARGKSCRYQTYDSTPPTALVLSGASA